MDDELRAELRAWQAGDQDAGERFLHARERAGHLVDPIALEVAAYLGDAVARARLGDDALAFMPPPSGLQDFLTWLPLPDLEVQLRACLALARACLDLQPRVHAPALEAADAWLACPCPEHLDALAAARVELRAAPTGARPAADALERTFAQLLDHLPSELDDGADGDHVPAERDVHVDGLAELDVDDDPLDVDDDPSHDWSELIDWLTGPIPSTAAASARAREAVRGALVPWVLVRPAGPPAWARGEWRVHRRGWQRETLAARASAPRGAPLYTGGVLPPALANEVLDGLPPAVARSWTATAKDAAVVVGRYLEAAGWRDAGKHVVSPEGDRRIALQRRLVKLEVRQQRWWVTPASWRGRPVHLTAWAAVILEGVRRAVSAPPPARRKRSSPAPRPKGRRAPSPAPATVEATGDGGGEVVMAFLGAARRLFRPR